MGVSELQRYIPLRWEDQLQVAVLFVGIYLLLRLVNDVPVAQVHFRAHLGLKIGQYFCLGHVCSF